MVQKLCLILQCQILQPLEIGMKMINSKVDQTALERALPLSTANLLLNAWNPHLHNMMITATFCVSDF